MYWLHYLWSRWEFEKVYMRYRQWLSRCILAWVLNGPSCFIVSEGIIIILGCFRISYCRRLWAVNSQCSWYRHSISSEYTRSLLSFSPLLLCMHDHLRLSIYGNEFGTHSYLGARPWAIILWVVNGSVDRCITYHRKHVICSMGIHYKIFTTLWYTIQSI